LRRRVLRRFSSRIDCGFRSECQVQKWKVIAHFVGVIAAVRGVAVSERSVVAVAPTFPLIQRICGASVVRIVGRRHFGQQSHIEVGAQIHGIEIVAHFAGTISSRGHVPVSKLAVNVIAKALEPAVQRRHTRMVVAEHHVLSLKTSAQSHGFQRVAHFSTFIPSANLVSVPELAVVIETPALQLVIRRNDASVLIAGRHLPGSESAAQIDSVQVVAERRCIPSAVGSVSVAELAEPIVAPAFDLRILAHRAVVVGPGDDLSGNEPASEVHRGHDIAHFPRCVPDVVGGLTVAQHPRARRPKAPDIVIRGECACVPCSEGHVRDCKVSAEVDGLQIIAHRVRGFADVIFVAVATASVATVAPAFEREVGDRANVFVAHSDRVDDEIRSEVNGRIRWAVEGGGVLGADHSAVAFPPTFELVVPQSTRLAVGVSHRDLRGTQRQKEAQHGQYKGEATECQCCWTDGRCCPLVVFPITDSNRWCGVSA